MSATNICGAVARGTGTVVLPPCLPSTDSTIGGGAILRDPVPGIALFRPGCSPVVVSTAVVGTDSTVKNGG